MFLLCGCGGLRGWDGELRGLAWMGGMPRPVDSRLRGNDGPGWDLQDWDGALHRFHPLIPVSSTGTGLSPLSSRERGFCRLFCTCSPRPVDTGSSPV